jgi:hypothetical protein
MIILAVTTVIVVSTAAPTGVTEILSTVLEVGRARLWPNSHPVLGMPVNMPEAAWSVMAVYFRLFVHRYQPIMRKAMGGKADLPPFRVTTDEM